MAILIDLKNVSKKIKNKTIFYIDDFRAEKGDFITILGESGAGKSTLLNILGLNADFSTGDYFLLGKNVQELNSKNKLLLKRKEISFLFQDFGLVEDETINFNLEIGLRYSSLSKREKLSEKHSALERVNLEKKLNTRVFSLSGGEKQKVALARILLKPSKIILADEPTGSLDSKNSNIIAGLLQKEASIGKVVCIVTHDPEIAVIGNKQLFLE